MLECNDKANFEAARRAFTLPSVTMRESEYWPALTSPSATLVGSKKNVTFDRNALRARAPAIPTPTTMPATRSCVFDADHVSLLPPA